MSGLNCFSEYSENSSIHGIKYIGERNRSACERSYWICSVVMAFLGCSFMIYEIYDKWENSPVIITFSENLRIISDVPFPAVTICPMSKFKDNEFDFKEAFKILRRADSQQDRRKMAESIEDSKNFEAGLFACDKDPTLKDGLEAAKLKGNDVIRRIKNISYSIPKTKQSYFYSYVTYQGKSESFRDYFTEIITEEGVCYSSNMLDMFEIFENENMLVLSEQYDDKVSNKMPKIKSNWSIQEGYPTESIDYDFYPKRAISSGTRGGLIITMRFNKNILKTSCLVGQKGFKVLLHNPGDIPNIKRQSFQSPFNQRTIVNIKPSMITTSQNLARTSPGRRQCYFEGEKKLKFFKNYTQSNCELECRSNSTLRACGCVKYFMVRDDETPICNITSLPCLKKFRGDYAKMMKHVMIYHEENEKNSEFFCNCLPTCTSVSYDFELSQISLDMEELNDFVKYVNNDDGDDFVTATFDIIFKDDYFMSSQRNEIYGWKDFIANCGGIIGLFIGTSLISFLEIIYFLIFKLMYQRKFGESKDELQLS